MDAAYDGYVSEVDLVLLDLTMPGMGGHEAFGRLRQVKPSVKIIVSSGYSEAEVSRRFGASADFLQKPYRASELISRVQEAFSGP